ncbi:MULTISPECIES: DUF350 domain-containing protein [Rhodobacterales]|uniref:DUF350 domain-containing protein n=1 Tax=Halocynthiibacter styelae TaxID=2761955 RepID=A0A8J7LQA3_9RHOB|nr:MULTISPECIES: DUF350 domain-containing protein [Rhodobacterales]MBI1494072.1 DUF350 domain-containing protein [Paenihalocynthiibacter styelae]
MDLFSAISLAEVVSTIVFSLIGIVILLLCWWVIKTFSPFPIVKEIEKDQNVALAILIASVFLSLSLIISAVILS